MALPATLSVTVNFSDGPVFGPSFTIGDPTYGKLGGVGTLGATTTPALILDVTAQTVKIDTRRGRNINQDLYEAGTAVIRVLDPNGDFNPQNTSSPLYGYLQPLRKVRITADNGTAYNIFQAIQLTTVIPIQ
jgi:mRNA-degrading endonuclease YafQ of YafQ-DinJ toxin-antitoxin module